MRRVRSTIVFAVGMMLVVGAAGCPKKKDEPKPTKTDAGGVKPTDDVVKIGVIHSATGEFAPFGEPVAEGLTQAVEELNAKGGIKGKKVQLVIEDDGSSAERAAKAFEKLATQDKVLAVIGPTSSDATRATAPLAEKFGITQITPTAHDSDLAGLPNTFVMFPTVEQTSERVAKLALEKFKAKKVAVINPANDWGKRSTEALTRTLGQGAQVVAAESFKDGEKEFDETVRKVMAAQPDVVVYPGYYDEETVAITEAVMRARPGDRIIIIIVGSACRMLLENPILEDPAFRKNIYIVDEGGGVEMASNVRSAEFHKAFRAKFNKAPSAYAAAAHAAVFAVKEALETAGNDSKKVAEALRAVKSETAFGKLDFAEKGMNRGAMIELFQPDEAKNLRVVQ